MDHCIISITVQGSGRNPEGSDLCHLFYSYTTKGETMQKHRKFGRNKKRFYLMVRPALLMPIMIQSISPAHHLLDNIMK